MSGLELKSGGELDCMVAELLGETLPRLHDWRYTSMSGYDSMVYRCKTCGVLALDYRAAEHGMRRPCVQCYSSNLDASFSAAERVGLFEKRHLTKGCSGGWSIRPNWDELIEPEDILFSGATAALAICGAIVNLMGRNDAE